MLPARHRGQRVPRPQVVSTHCFWFIGIDPAPRVPGFCCLSTPTASRPQTLTGIAKGGVTYLARPRAGWRVFPTQILSAPSVSCSLFSAAGVAFAFSSFRKSSLARGFECSCRASNQVTCQLGGAILLHQHLTVRPITGQAQRVQSRRKRRITLRLNHDNHATDQHRRCQR